MNQVLPAIFEMVINIAMLLLFIRFFLQFAGLKRSNPLLTPAYKTTKIVDIFGDIFPDMAKGRFCTAAVVLMFLVKIVFISGTAAMAQQGIAPIALFVTAAFSLILSFLNVFFYIIVASVILSWVIMLTQNMNPLFEIIMHIAEPVIAPFRRISPDLGMLDISPIFAFFGIYLAEIIVKEAANTLLPML